MLFNLGDSLLVHPVTSSGSTSVNVYLPGKSELWFDVETFQKFQGGQQLSLPVTLDKVLNFLSLLYSFNSKTPFTADSSIPEGRHNNPPEVQN